MSLASRLRALGADTRPLEESRDFRLLFVAGTVFAFGAMVSGVAVPFQIYALTGSNFAVGAVGLVELVPLIVLGLYGGALADHVDRRRMLIATGIAQALCTTALAVNAFSPAPSIAAIFVVAVLLTSAAALQRPSREALLPRTVAHDRIPAANALSSLGSQLGLLGGPAVGGLLIASVGIGWCFVVDITGLMVATAMYELLRPYPHRVETTPPSLAGIAEGLRYAIRRRDLLGTYLVDIAAMLLALLVALFLALSGAADMISGVFRGTVWNQTIPEEMRGRLAGIEMLSYSVGPIGGQVRAGITADLWSVRGSIVSGGVACVAGVAITAALLRDFWSYDARTDPHAVAERAVRAAAGES